MFLVSFVLILYFDWLLGPHKRQNFEKNKTKKHSKIFSSETVKWMNHVLCIHVPDSSLYIICVFYSSQIRTGRYGFHRLIMGKVEISYFFWTNCRYLNFVFAEIFIEYISMFHVTFFLILYFDWLLGPHKG